MKAQRAAVVILAIALAASWSWMAMQLRRSKAAEATNVEPTRASATPAAASPTLAGAYGENNPEHEPVLEVALQAEQVLSVKPDEFSRRFSSMVGALPGTIEYPQVTIGIGYYSPNLLLLLRRWGEVDPQTALNAINASSLPTAEFDTYRFKNDWANCVLAGWVTQNPTATWQWATDASQPGPLQKGNPSEGRLDLMIEALTETGQFDEAGSLLATMGNEFRGDNWGLPAAERMETAWSRSDPAAAMAWAAKLPPEKRDSVTMKIVRIWAAHDYNGATAFVNGISNVSETTRAAWLAAAKGAAQSDK